MSATLTWSEYHGESNLQSTFSATNQGALQLLNQYFTTLAGFADFPWQICSTELTTSPWYITLKRKSGAAGRIIFVGINASVGTTLNPQLSADLAWSTPGVRAAWFPSATSDTPANIVAVGGDVFSVVSGYTTLSPNMPAAIGGNNFSCWACEDGLFIRYGSSSVNSGILFVGNLIEDASGSENGIAFYAGSSLESVNPGNSGFNSTTVGGLRYDSGVLCHFGTGWTPTTSVIASSMRDNSLKKIWTLPRSIYSYQLTLGDGFKYKLRQIAYGPTSLAGFERIAVDGDITKAQFTFPTATSAYPWLTNYQV